MASMARHAATAPASAPPPIPRFELLEILSDVACNEARHLAPNASYHRPDSKAHHHLTSLSSPSTLGSSSTVGHSSSPNQPSTPRPTFPTFHLYTSAFVRRAPSTETPFSMMRRVIGNVGATTTTTSTAPRHGGIRKPGVRATLTPPLMEDIGGGWKGRSTPSRFCHICSRTAKKVELLACANLASGACRKVVCEKCFAEYKWDWKTAEKNRSSWQCTHCRRVCPRRAQCAIYRRTNERRREQQQAARARLQNNRTLSTHSDNDQGNHSILNTGPPFNVLTASSHLVSGKGVAKSSNIEGGHALN